MVGEKPPTAPSVVVADEVDAYVPPTDDDEDALPPRVLRTSDLVQADADGNFADEVKFLAAMGALLENSTADIVLNKADKPFVELSARVYEQMDDQGEWNGTWDAGHTTFTTNDPQESPTYTLVKPLKDINVTVLTFRHLKVRDLVGIYNGRRTGNVAISRALLAKATGVRERALDQLYIGDWMAAQDGLRPFLPVLTTGLLSLAS